jgi:hypothetical protein
MGLSQGKLSQKNVELEFQFETTEQPIETSQ